MIKKVEEWSDFCQLVHDKKQTEHGWPSLEDAIADIRPPDYVDKPDPYKNATNKAPKELGWGTKHFRVWINHLREKIARWQDKPVRLALDRDNAFQSRESIIMLKYLKNKYPYWPTIHWLPPRGCDINPLGTIFEN